MRILRLRTALGTEGLRKALDDLDAVVVRPAVAESLEEFGLAEHLARKAFGRKENIARQLRLEFLLWLTGKTDIRSALAQTEPREAGSGVLVVVFSDSDARAVCRALDAVELPLGLKKKGEPLALERISLSRAGK